MVVSRIDNLAQIAWSDGELNELALSNFDKHASSVIMRGATTIDIMPFGIGTRNVSLVEIAEEFPGLDFDELEEEDEGVEEEKEELVFQEEKEGDLFDEFLGLDVDMLEESAPANQQSDQVFEGFAEEFPGLDVEELGVEEEDRVVFQPAVFTDGREINYANVTRVGRFAHGISRLEFFRHMVSRMEPKFLEREGEYSHYQIAATFSHKVEDGSYGRGVVVNFGTTSAADGETRIVPHNVNVWPFDIHDPLSGVINPPLGTEIVMGDMIPFNSRRVGVDANFAEFLNKLFSTFEARIPAGSDSGRLLYEDTTLHMMNLFLYKLRRPNRVAGGENVHDISGKTSNTASFSQKSVFSPPVTAKNTCFWECVYYFLHVRYEHTDPPEGAWFTSHLVFIRDKLANRKDNGRASVKRMIHKHVDRLRDEYYRRRGREADDEMVPLECFVEILGDFNCDSVVVLNEDGDAVVGDVEMIENRRIVDGDFMAMWVEDHLHLILSYTGSLVVKKCRRCDVRFTSTSALKRHLESQVCMTCVCKAKGEGFGSEAEWSDHMARRSLICPKYRLMNADSTVSSGSGEEGRSVRFRNDQKRNYYQKKKHEQDEFERDHAPMRNSEECIYFDLESVVPMNAAGTARDQQAVQIPYATGWILRSEALRGEEVTIEYGEDCMERFVTYLDGMYEEIKKDEIDVWVRRASQAAMDDPVPRKSKGFKNYAMRLKDSWDNRVRGVENEDPNVSPGCLICNDFVDETHGYRVDGNKYTFSQCCLAMYARNAAEKNLEKNFNNNAPRISIWAHNGGKYDWVFMHRHLMESGRLDDLSTVRSNSKYYQLSYKDVFQFKDSLNFMQGSLDTLGRNFGVETLKGIFPYRLLTTMEDTEVIIRGEDAVRQTIPHEYLQVTEKVAGPMGLSRKRAMHEDEYREFFEERGWFYNVKSETIKYLADDVKVLFGVVEKFRSGWLNMPHSPQLFNYMTIGQMCHSYFLEHYLEKEKYPCLDIAEDRYIRKALYGGRTEVFRRVAPEGSRIHYVDVNSLYPYVMESRDLPCGDPVWHFRRDDGTQFEFTNSPFPIQTRVEDDAFFEKVACDLNGGDSHSIYGFVEVDVSCSLTTLYPILPEKRSLDGEKTFKNMFTNMSKKRMVYYTEELKRAVQNGCQVTKVWSYSEWQRGRVYGNLIRVLKEQKLLGEGKDINGCRIEGVAKNPSLRAAAKTAQNSLFGKTIQFVDSGVQLVHTRERLFKLVESPFSQVSIKPVFSSEYSDVVEVTTRYTIPRVQTRSCAAFGTAILAEARLVLYDYFEKVMDVGGEILYCDTDSIVFAGDQPLGDECMDDCEYGKMKVEIDPDTIKPGGFCAMSPKCYAFDLEGGDPYVRFKGVVMSENLNLPEERDGIDALLNEMECEEMIRELALPFKPDDVVSKGVSFEQMKGLINGGIKALLTKQMQFQKTTARTVSACEVVKVTQCHFDKRIVAMHGMTFPWNDFNMNMERIVSEEDVHSLSDYLGFIFFGELEQWMERYKDSEFFRSIVDSWRDSDNGNAILYNATSQSREFSVGCF
jgi:hypothetical protein